MVNCYPLVRLTAIKDKYIPLRTISIEQCYSLKKHLPKCYKFAGIHLCNQPTIQLSQQLTSANIKILAVGKKPQSFFQFYDQKQIECHSVIKEFEFNIIVHKKKVNDHIQFIQSIMETDINRNLFLINNDTLKPITQPFEFNELEKSVKIVWYNRDCAVINPNLIKQKYNFRIALIFVGERKKLYTAEEVINFIRQDLQHSSNLMLKHSMTQKIAAKCSEGLILQSYLQANTQRENEKAKLHQIMHKKYQKNISQSQSTPGNKLAFYSLLLLLVGAIIGYIALKTYD